MKDRVIVITGASAGIGAAVAEKAGAAGARVVLAARRRAELERVAKASGPEALAVVTDVTVRAQVEALARAAIERFGHVDVWINNAGRGITRAPSELTDEDIDAMVLHNLKSPLYGMQAILPHFRERGAGQIINVSTLLGRVPFAPIRSAYSAAKHALNAITAMLRMELRASCPGVIVTLISPGIVATDFGLNALHGGPDNRVLPNAQPVGEVAEVILDAIQNPRVDVYTQPGAAAMVRSYFEDIDAAEKRMPGAAPRRP
jgi:NADP-dependent 3-hydroxy acid dehydrogenase YdfG